MMRRIYYYLLSALLVVLVAACSTTRNVKTGTSFGSLSEKEYMEELITRFPAWDAVTAKISLSVHTGSKSLSKLGGTLRLKRDEVIQLSLTYLLGIEVGRAEITPSGMRVIDRINKRYVEVSFDELKKMVNADLDFYTLQALFMNRIFLPGKKVLTARDVSSFTALSRDETTWIEVKNPHRFTYRFCTGSSDGLLKETHIGLSGTDYGVDWLYDNFHSLGNGQFPGSMQVVFKGGKRPARATFELSRLSTNSDWETHTDLSEKYEPIGLQELLNVLLK